MAELMAFVVLSLPILAILLIVVLAALAARAAARRMEVPEKKWKAGVLAALIVILIPTWDEIVGRLYFHYFCAAQGGAKINKQIKLQPEYWNADGSPVFLDARGSKIRSKLDDQYSFKTESIEHFSKIFRIRRDIYPVVDRGTGELFGTYTYFTYFGGWLQNYTSLNIRGVNCPDERNFYSHFLRSIFVSEQDKTIRR